MGKHGKKFLNMSDYEAFKGGGDYVEPNVSLIEDGYVVMFNPKAILLDGIARLVYSGSGTAQLIGGDFEGMDYIEEMTIDGTQVTPSKTYDFETD